MNERNGFLLDKVEDIRGISVTGGTRGYEGGARGQRAKNFPDGEIKAEGRELQKGIGGLNIKELLHPELTVSDAAMNIHGSLGSTRGAGGINEISEVIERGERERVLIGEEG